MAKVNNLQDLCFSCPDGTIGVVSGFASAEFDCKTERDRDYIYKCAAKIGCSIDVIVKPMKLLVKYI